MRVFNAKAVREARLIMKLTQKELARRIGISRQSVNLIENGIINPTAKIIAGLASVLGVREDYFFTDKE